MKVDYSQFSERGLIEATELRALLDRGASGIKLVDGTYVGAAAPVPASDLFTAKRIGNAVYFDIDSVADPRSDMAHMLPPAELFAKAVGGMGITNDDLVVVYDQNGIAMAASRVWWMFRVFGHKNVCVLNGGLPYWAATGNPLATGAFSPPAPVTFKARFNPDLVRDLDAMRAACGAGRAIVDARNAERFSGKAREFSDRLRSGHIPGSINVPFMSLINPEDGRLEDDETIGRLLEPLTHAGDIISTCGSGVTACVLALAFHAIGKKDVAVYDGSWTEWGRIDAGTEVATS